MEKKVTFTFGRYIVGEISALIPFASVSFIVESLVDTCTPRLGDVIEGE